MKKSEFAEKYNVNLEDAKRDLAFFSAHKEPL